MVKKHSKNFRKKPIIRWLVVGIAIVGIIIIVLGALCVLWVIPSQYSDGGLGTLGGDNLEASYESASKTSLFEDSLLESESGESEEIAQSPDESTTETTGVVDEDTFEKKIIKTGTIYSVVDDLDSAAEDSEKITTKYDGYVINLTKNADEKGSDDNISLRVRVPVESFEKAIKEFEELGLVTYEVVQGDDVTDQYIDLKSRLSNLEAAELQYLEIMKKATKIEDILKVQEALAEVREDIEIIQGSIDYLEKSADLSTIYVYFSLKERAVPVTDESWDPVGTMRLALRALVGAGQFAADLMIYIVILSPVVLVPALVIWGIVKLIKRRKADRRV